MKHFNSTYFMLFIALLIIECLIAVFITDNIIRPYGGDVLVVILLYCFIKSFFNIPVKLAAFYVLCFAAVVEALQHFDFLNLIGLGDVLLANILLGNYFSWIDMLCYVMGILLVLFAEDIRRSFQSKL